MGHKIRFQQIMTTKQCKVIIQDEVNCIISGLHPDHVGYFYEEYSAFAPNHFFSPKFKLGSWDGKIRYFHKTGKTYVNLLDDIVPRIIGLGYKLSLEDLRTSTQVTPQLIDENFFKDRGIVTESGEPWIIRDYQVNMVNTLIQSGGGVGLASTGSGKTSMTAALALSYEEAANIRSIIIVPDKNLTDQTKTEYEFFGLDVGEYSGTTKDLNHQHVVSTWQALKNVPTIIQQFGMVILDEAHTAKGQVITSLLNDYGRKIPLRFGVTGTLPKAETDAMAIRIAFGEVRYRVDAHSLIQQGHLAKLHIDVMQLENDLTSDYDQYVNDLKLSNSPDKPMTYKKFKDSYFPDWSSEKRFMQSDNIRLQWIADYIDIKRKDGNVFCLVDGIRFGKKLAEMIPNAVFLHGTDKMVVRKEIYQRFAENDNLVVLATMQIASTGLNIKRIFNMMVIDGGKSFVRIIQTIGRGLRKAKDKDFVHFTDICSDFKYSKRHLKERTKFYEEAQYPYKKHVVKL